MNEKMTDQPKPVAPADHEPFEPMACCGRERDKDGGRNPHCECPAELKPKPVAPDTIIVKLWCDDEDEAHVEHVKSRSAVDPCRMVEAYVRREYDSGWSDHVHVFMRIDDGERRSFSVRVEIVLDVSVSEVRSR